MKRRPLLQSPLQLSLFDFEQASAAPIEPPTPQIVPQPSEDTIKPALKRRSLPGERNIEYTLQRSKRRSIGFMIEDNGLRVTAPRWVTIAEIEDALRSKLAWIIRKLDELQQRMVRQQNDAIEWRDGARIAFLGGSITLRIGMRDSAAHALFDSESTTLMLPLPPDVPQDKLKARTLRWLQEEARRLFAQRLPHFAEKLGVSFHSFALSSATTQWGSCTAQGRIRLNWRLIHLSPELIDYVVAHELAHLREMNHSPRFWATVQLAFPDYKNARKILRGHSPGAMPSS